MPLSSEQQDAWRSYQQRQRQNVWAAPQTVEGPFGPVRPRYNMPTETIEDSGMAPMTDELRDAWRQLQRQRQNPWRAPQMEDWRQMGGGEQGRSRQPNITITIGSNEPGGSLENPTNPLSQLVNFYYPPQYQAQRQAQPPTEPQRTYLPMRAQNTGQRMTWPTGQPVPMNEPLPWSRIDNPWRVVEQIERQTGRQY